MVAAGLGDAVVFAESADALGSDAAGVVSQQQPQRIVFVSGTAALAASIENEVRSLVDGVQVERLAGTDRIHTAALAAQQVLAEVASPTVVLANGWALDDVGIAAAIAAALDNSAVLYARPGMLDDATAKVLTDHRPTQILIVDSADPADQALRAQIAPDAVVIVVSSPAQSTQRALGTAGSSPS